MKNQKLELGFSALLMTVMTSCAAIEGIFKAGVWSGIFIVVAVVIVIVWIISKAGRK